MKKTLTEEQMASVVGGQESCTWIAPYTYTYTTYYCDNSGCTPTTITVVVPGRRECFG